mgnify:CR=1 FL=1
MIRRHASPFATTPATFYGPAEGLAADAAGSVADEIVAAFKDMQPAAKKPKVTMSCLRRAAASAPATAGACSARPPARRAAGAKTLTDRGGSAR